MPKAELKTKKTEASVEEFLNTIDDEQKRADAFTVLELMSKLSGEKPKMWGPSIVGFGSRTMKYASGRELEWLYIGFSPRKANLSLYLAVEGLDKYDALMKKLGKHSTGKGCLYIKRLSDVDMKVLKELVAAALKHAKGK